MEFVYNAADTPYLLEHWLRESAGRRAVVLTDSRKLEQAAALKTRCDAIAEVIVVPADLADRPEERNRLSERLGEAASITLVADTDFRELKFVPGVRMPVINPLYPVVRNLWALGRRAFDIYTLAGTQRIAPVSLLDAFEKKHAGKRAFIAGNGPSLNQIGMGRLENEITFGSNRCYMGYEKWGFPFRYWGIIDQLQIEEYRAEYEDNLPAETIKFFPFEYLPLFRAENACPVNFSYNSKPPYRFSADPGVLYLGFTVTHLLLQIAVIMGCNPIYLIGIDHNYNLKDPGKEDLMPVGKTTLKTRLRGHVQKTRAWKIYQAYQQIQGHEKPVSRDPALERERYLKNRIWEARDASKPTHFTDKYTGGPKRFVKPRPEMQEICFRVARDWAQENGVEIYNATPGTQLDVFPLIDYDSLF
jgi:hypothetical protein